MEGFWLGALVTVSMTVGATIGLVTGALLSCSARQQRKEEIKRESYATAEAWQTTCREVMRGIWS